MASLLSGGSRGFEGVGDRDKFEKELVSAVARYGPRD